MAKATQTKTKKTTTKITFTNPFKKQTDKKKERARCDKCGRFL